MPATVCAGRPIGLPVRIRTAAAANAAVARQVEDVIATRLA
ncbi:MAG TPA: hypothetical protein VMU51_38985 [Mycobacteriales bacterium]|nr:hypothetical protein [Mycobacteriales bacterium]